MSPAFPARAAPGLPGARRAGAPAPSERARASPPARPPKQPARDRVRGAPRDAPRAGDLWRDDIDAIVVPADACGGAAHTIAVAVLTKARARTPPNSQRASERVP